MTKIKAAVRTFCDTAAFLCIAKGEFYENRNKWGNVFCTACLCGDHLLAVRIIKYFIRYGIDYYFEKLAEYQKNQKHTED